MKRRVLAILALFALSCGGEHEDGLARVRRAGVLRWGGDIQGGEPYVFDDPEHPGRLIGFEVELADEIARELGVRAEFVQQDWSNLVPALERGSFDVAMNGLEVTPSRAGTVLFTRPYFVFSAQLVVRNDERRVRDLTTVRGRRIGTLANSMSWDLLQDTGAVVVPYEGVEEPYQDLSSRRLDGVLLDDIIATRYGLVHRDLRLAADVGDGYYALALRKDDETLRAAIDRALANIARSGRLRRILAHWNIDSERQAQLASWTDEDTQAMLRPRRQASFTLRHLVLFLEGAAITLLVSTLAMFISVIFGMALALTRQYGPGPIGRIVQGYVELFRGTPVLLQLFLLYFGIMPWLRALADFQAGVEYDAFIAAVIGLGLNYAAYEAEIIRSGLGSVPPGQMEAARALGMTTSLAVRRIILPQALRISLPGMTNDFISLLKDSSLVSVITVVELTKRMTITAVDVRSWLIPGLLCAALYLAMSYPLARISLRLEKSLEGG
jgi:polar amino acid transport system substrate-binding protein